MTVNWYHQHALSIILVCYYLQYIHHTIDNNTTHLLLSEVVSIIYKKMMVLDSDATERINIKRLVLTLFKGF